MDLLGAPRKKLSFRLHTENGVTPNCTIADVETALREVVFDRKLAFLVLEPETPIGGVRFLQATGLPNGFQIEMSVRAGEGWQLYQRQTAYSEMLEKLFSDFLNGSAPPLDSFSPYSL